MTDRPVEPDIALEIEEMRQRNRAAVIRLIEARHRFHRLRDGKSDLPVFPLEPENGVVSTGNEVVNEVVDG